MEAGWDAWTVHDIHNPVVWGNWVEMVRWRRWVPIVCVKVLWNDAYGTVDGGFRGNIRYATRKYGSEHVAPCLSTYAFRGSFLSDRFFT